MIRTEGARARRRKPQRKTAYDAVNVRAQNRCELCLTPASEGVLLEHHHIFGRGNKAGIPYEVGSVSVLDSAELIALVCVRPYGSGGCHRDAERNQDIKELLESVACERFAWAHGLDLDETLTPLDRMRDLCRQLEDADSS